MNINKVIIFGNVTRDPEMRQLPSGTTVVNLGVATNRVYRNQAGEKTQDTEFHTVVLFGRTAEVAQQYLKKGSSVLIEGRLHTNSWETDGVKRYRTEIIAENMQLGPRRDGGGGAEHGHTESAKAPEYPENKINPDDIPF